MSAVRSWSVQLTPVLRCTVFCTDKCQAADTKPLMYLACRAWSCIHLIAKGILVMKMNKHFEEFSEAAQVEIYRSASLQLNIVKLRLRFHSYQIK